MTVEGGAGVGVAFRVSTNGIGYTALHYFNSRETNGASPYGSLTLANGALYGTTYHRRHEQSRDAVPHGHRWRRLHQSARIRRRHERRGESDVVT